VEVFSTFFGVDSALEGFSDFGWIASSGALLFYTKKKVDFFIKLF
jgi:hypothetical protein